MWWKLKKVIDDGSRIVYQYARESESLDGQIEYNKGNQTISCIKLCSGDTESSVKRFFPHVFQVIVKENAPAEKFITIG